MGTTTLDTIKGITGNNLQLEADLLSKPKEYLCELIQVQQNLIRENQELYGTKSDLYLRLQQEYKNQLERFKDLKPFLNKEGQVKLEKLLKNKPLESEISIKTVEFQFNAVNHKVYKNLEILAPSLSKNERFLCIYLHMNYSPKGIAFLTMKNINAVNVAFNRIRVKLNLKTNQDLVKYLASLA